jgi:hypothetical protein
LHCIYYVTIPCGMHKLAIGTAQLLTLVCSVWSHKPITPPGLGRRNENLMFRVDCVIVTIS